MLRQLTIDMIDSSKEIQDWLKQFPACDQITAVALLLNLRFVTRDVYAKWLQNTLANLGLITCGLYAVRKIEDSISCIWNEKGEMVCRPASSLGSEDLVQSVIANLVKENSTRYLDHPSLSEIKKSREFHIVLIDDSIGSGNRVCSFIGRMMSHKSFLSRWSYGWIRIHIIAYSRSVASEKKILNSIPGSDHGVRVYRKSEKVQFIGEKISHDSFFESRYGEGAIKILDLCNAVTLIPKNRRRGYGNTMSNIVFYHSVPNNLPGIIWFQSERWNALFPRRSVPEWLPNLLEGREHRSSIRANKLPKSLRLILNLIKRGQRRVVSLSHASGFDSVVVKKILEQACASGFVTESNRLTAAGLKAIWEDKSVSDIEQYERSLYIPTKWCAGRGTVQPFLPSGVTLWEETEFASSLLRVDGDVGQASLERTDAKTAMPSLNVTTQNPSATREGGDIHGPLDRKEK